MTVVPRTCTELRDNDANTPSHGNPQSLSAFRECPAYVLLGDPGMGKTTEFRKEAHALDQLACDVTARDFANFDAEDHPEWVGKTLFIDGLDEIRAGQTDPSRPFDRIRRNLDKLGRPRFRLSCRTADWLTTDQRRLADVSPSGEVTVLGLKPLELWQSAMLIEGEPSVENASAFLEHAQERGLEGLLANPQSLILLVRAVRDGTWPENRHDAFEKACLAMATEHNEEHQDIRPAKDPSKILDAAGHLCTALLISGIPGYALSSGAANDDYPCMADLGLADDDCRQAAASGLFRHPQAGRAEPVHRHIAEYLAGRRLASLTESGRLPCRRVLALMSGADGNVVTQLRGLSAWLGVHSTIARPHLIAQDPIGLALYGDIQAYSPEELRTLFHSLVREPRRLEPTHRTATAFASLATPAMLDVIKQTLDNPPSGADEPFVVDFVLRLISRAQPLQGLAPTLLRIVRDDTQWPRIREAGLDAFIHYADGDDCDADLLALLRDVKEGRLRDPEGQTLGKLLSTLFPRRITPSAVWQYFKENDPVIAGAYMRFWVEELPLKVSDIAVADVLDGCCGYLSELERASDPTLACCVAKLLGRGLESHGDRLANNRLYDWLDAGVRLRVSTDSTQSHIHSIRRWIEARPHRHLEIFLEGMQRLSDDSWYSPYEALQRLFGAEPTTDFYIACLREAKSMAACRPSVAQSLLRLVVKSGSLKPEHMRDLIADDASLTNFLDHQLEPPTLPQQFVGLEQRQQERVEERQRETRDALNELKANEDVLRANRASPALLHSLARTYFDTFMRFTPEKGTRRLEERVGRDTQLLEAVQTALRLALHRDDVPDADTILAQRIRSKMHYLCWPYLAGLAEAERTGSLDQEWWTAPRIRTALAAYFAYAHGDYEPSWYRHLIAEHSALVAAVQVQFASALFREGLDISDGNINLWHLAFDPPHAKVARHACLPLLRAFPSRARRDQLPVLEYLLLAAIKHADPPKFRQLIQTKLAQKSLPPCHRGRWLAAGCTTAIAEFAPATEEFVRAGRQQARARHLASLFSPQDRLVFPVERTGPLLAALLIRLVGRFSHPDESSEGYVTADMRASMLVSHCIRVLAGEPDTEATDALARLLEDPQLSRWRHALAHAADDQRVIHRDYKYRHPSLNQVVEVLSGGAPAGPRDLAALVLTQLEDIAFRIRSGDLDQWKQYWNEDRLGPTDPKPEESCTRALLHELRPMLPKGVHAEREAHYPNNTRADIRVSYQDYHIPIEVRRNDHRDLWRAPTTQLVAKYASDPATGGHGIYVVLWFGHDRTQRSPSGRRPEGPTDLKQQLEAALSDQYRHSIRFLVVDVSRPHGQRT